MRKLALFAAIFTTLLVFTACNEIREEKEKNKEMKGSETPKEADQTNHAQK